MTTPSLSRVTLETMANYRTVVSQIVAASGAGSRRFVEAVDGALARPLVQRTVAVVPAAAERLDAARDAASRFALQGIGQAVAFSEQVIERGSVFATAQVERWAHSVGAFDNRYVAQGVETAARLSLPAAQLVLKVSGKVAEGAAQLADVAGAHPVKGAARRAANTSRRAATQAKARTKIAARRGRQAVDRVVESAPAKRVRRAAKQAAQ